MKTLSEEIRDKNFRTKIDKKSKPSIIILKIIILLRLENGEAKVE